MEAVEIKIQRIKGGGDGSDNVDAVNGYDDDDGDEENDYDHNGDDNYYFFSGASDKDNDGGDEEDVNTRWPSCYMVYVICCREMRARRL